MLKGAFCNYKRAGTLFPRAPSSLRSKDNARFKFSHFTMITLDLSSWLYLRGRYCSDASARVNHEYQVFSLTPEDIWSVQHPYQNERTENNERGRCTCKGRARMTEYRGLRTFFQSSVHCCKPTSVSCDINIHSYRYLSL